MARAPLQKPQGLRAARRGQVVMPRYPPGELALAFGDCARAFRLGSLDPKTKKNKAQYVFFLRCTSRFNDGVSSAEREMTGEIC